MRLIRNYVICHTYLFLFSFRNNHNSQPGMISEHFLAASPSSSDDYVLVDVHPGQVVGSGRLVDERYVEGGLSPEVELGFTCKYDIDSAVNFAEYASIQN